MKKVHKYKQKNKQINSRGESNIQVASRPHLRPHIHILILVFLIMVRFEDMAPEGARCTYTKSGLTVEPL